EDMENVLLKTREELNSLAESRELMRKEKLNLEKRWTEFKRNKENLETILRELQVLKAWALRRKGEPYNKINLIKSKIQHNSIIKTYPEDYRFYLSLFLTRVNWLYPFKDFYRNDLNEINQYVQDTILIGTQTMDRINDINKKGVGTYLYQIHKTMINSLCFVNCVRLDLLLLQNKNLNQKSKKSIKLLQEIIAYKRLRKERNPKSRDNYESLTSSQPVFSYVESYVEYLEASMKKNGAYEKLKFAKQSIDNAIKSVKKDREHRAFFFECCLKLSELISAKMEALDSEYESFIMNIKVTDSVNKYE
ncbi:MAG: hypothetical protein AAGC45_01155, partial [Bacteroidota bacterium]